MSASLRRAEAGGLSLPPPWLAEGLTGFSSAPAFCDANDSPLFLDRRRRTKLRIVNFIALSGSAGLWGPAAINASLLAASEINRRGGILGRELELVFRDAGGDVQDVARQAVEIIDNDEADILVGSHISAVRVALREVATGRIPYIYTPVYEGGERTPGVMAIGETPRKQMRPAIQWLADTKRAQRWYLIGSDYVWPWLSHRATKRYIRASGGCVVGEEFVPMGQHDHEAHLARIKAAKPDVVAISLIGTDSVSFNRAFAEHGLSARILRFCGAMDETVLLGIGADGTENLYCSSGYFAEFASRDNDAFRARYQAAFGRCAPPVGSVAESNYEGLKFLEAVAVRAGSIELRPLMATAKNVGYRAARGDVTIHDGSADMPIFLAEADGLDFRLLKQF